MLGEDWETPGRILELQEAVVNFTAVWGALWLGDPTPVVLLKTMVHINWGAQCGEDEKGTVRYNCLGFFPCYHNIIWLKKRGLGRIRIRRT
jgi:hypothetical protein